VTAEQQRDQIKTYLRTSVGARSESVIRQELRLPDTPASRATTRQRLEELARDGEIVFLESGLVMTP